MRVELGSQDSLDSPLAQAEEEEASEEEALNVNSASTNLTEETEDDSDESDSDVSSTLCGWFFICTCATPVSSLLELTQYPCRLWKLASSRRWLGTGVTLCLFRRA